MHYSLNQCEARLEEIDRALMDPRVLSKVNRLRELTKERAHIEPMVLLWRELERTKQEISEAKDLLSDPEMREMAEKHGDVEPAKWKWGAGTPCADVFEADDAKRKYEDLTAKVTVFTAFRDESSTQSIQAASSSGEKEETRERSRSPRAQLASGIAPLQGK